MLLMAVCAVAALALAVLVGKLWHATQAPGRSAGTGR